MQINQENPKKLNNTIRREIGNRIALCFVLLLAVVMLSTAVEFRNWMTQVKQTAQNMCKDLEDFTVSQLLIQNNDAIEMRLRNFNNTNESIHVSWNMSTDVSTSTDSTTPISIDTEEIPLSGRMSWVVPFGWQYKYPLHSILGQKFGYFSVRGSLFGNHLILSELLVRSGMLFVFALLIFIVLYPVASNIPNRLIFTPMINLLALLENQKKPERLDRSGAVLEFEEIQEIEGRILKLIKQVESNSRAAVLGQVAGQVAHDIRSPIAALDSVISRLGQLPEQERVFMRSAISRIKDIANNLLQKNREIAAASQMTGTKVEQATIVAGVSEALSTQLLSSLIDPLITEKRMQFRSKIGIEIDGRIDSTSYGLFARIQPTEFKRVFSNLINNAVEVLGENGFVVLTLLGRDNEIEITVRDNGKGISPEIIERLGQRGETHGKAGGSGLGLYHARTSVESWGGRFRIESEINKGTAVIATLPRVYAPEWFVSALKLIPGSSVVILDDDSSIHQIWQGRLDSLRVSEKQITVVHVSTPDQLRTWIRESPTSVGQALYLADYELLGYRETGLSLIEEMKLGPQSILVTSRFEERQIVEGCQKLKVRLIPKGMAGFVPISFGVALENVDAILIDDDDLVHMTWVNAAEKAGKNLKIFSHPDQFFVVAETFCKSSPVYVDANLGQGIKGEEVAERIHKMGFKRVFLATGYEPDNYRQHKFLEGILGKSPPFGDGIISL